MDFIPIVFFSKNIVPTWFRSKSPLESIKRHLNIITANRFQ